METIDKVRRYYYSYAKKSRRKTSHSIFPWGITVFLAGMGVAILFLALSESAGFGNNILSATGICSLVLIITGLILMIKNDKII